MSGQGIQTKAAWAGLLVLALLFGAFRVISPSDIVLGEGDGERVSLLGVDSYFHVRHAEWTAQNFPRHMRGDPGSHYPGIEHQEVSGLYNLGLAAAARVGSAFADPTRALLLSAAWSPVVLGLLALVLIFLTAGRIAGTGTALLAGVLFLLFPGNYAQKSALGFADQHTLEVLITLMVLAGLVIALQSERGRNLTYLSKITLSSSPFALLTITWLGYPLLLGLLGVCLLLVMILAMGTDAGQELGLRLLCLLLPATVLMALLYTLAPGHRMELLPDIHQWVLIGMGFLMFMAGLTWLVPRQVIRLRTRRILSVLVVLVLMLGGVLIVQYHPLGDDLWFWSTFVRASDVGEQAAVTLGSVLTRFSLPLLMTLAGLVVWALFPSGVNDEPGRVMGRSAQLLILVFGLASLLIWVRTKDFDYLPAAFLALSSATGGSMVWRVIVQRALFARIRGLLGRPGWTLIGVLITALFIAGMAVGPLDSPWVDRAEAESLLVSDDAWFEGMAWMRTQTPAPTRGPQDAGPKEGPYDSATYGVFSGWDHGNFIAWEGHRLPAASRYPTRYDAGWLTATRESQADSLLCPACRAPEHVKYVAMSWREPTVYYQAKVISAGKKAVMHPGRIVSDNGESVTLFDFGPEWETSMATRMTKYHGSGLSHYRIVWESEAQRLQQKVVEPSTETAYLTSDPLPNGVKGPPTGNDVVTEVDGRWIHDVHVVPSLRIYEVVQGAVVQGRAEPGDTVEALNLVHVEPLERDYLYRSTTVANEQGEWNLTIPYPGLDLQPAASVRVGTQRPWQFNFDGQSTFRRLGITVDQVLQGDTLNVDGL